MSQLGYQGNTIGCLTGGETPLQERIDNLKMFREGQKKMLITTDGFARGWYKIN